MEYSTENLVRVVCQFYQTDSVLQAEANQWLSEAKVSPQAWNFVWELLDPQKPTEVQFFGATTLYIKIEKALNELNDEQLVALQGKLLTTIIAYNAGPKMVLNKLCTSLSAYLLQTCPEKWQDALPEILIIFTPENVPQVPSDVVIKVLLEVLTVLPEELTVIRLTQHQRGLIRHHFNENTGAVLSLLEKIISSHSDHEIIAQAIKCVSSWIGVGDEIIQCQNLANILISLIFNTHKNHKNISKQSFNALVAILNKPDLNKHPTFLLELLTKILPLHEIIARELMLPKPDQELIQDVYGLFITFGEVHSHLFLDWLRGDGIARQQVMTLVTFLLHCSGARGSYPTDETYSRLAFGFWYILQDEIISSEAQDYELFMILLGPIFKELVNILIVKAQIPDPQKNLSQEDAECFRCYRQDIGDTLTCCYSILRETTLSIIKLRLEEVNPDETTWRELEACLFSLCSIAENVNLDDVVFLPALFHYIRNLPFQRLNPKVLSTTLDTIGAFAEWISAHSGTLEHVLPLITIGLNVPEASPSATMALKDLARDCQCAMKPYATLILGASQEALHGGRLKHFESMRLMYSVGRILSVLPPDTIMQYLDIILTPYLDQLNGLAVQQPSAQIKNNVLMCLKMIGMLSATLDTRPDANAAEYVPPPPSPQPVLLILHKLLPVMKLISNSWSNDTLVMKALFSALKNAVTTLLEDSQPVLPEVLDLILTSYKVHPRPPALDLTLQFCILFGKDEKYEAMMQTLTNELCALSLAKVSSSPNISDHTDLLEALFVFLSHVIKKIPKLFIYVDSVSLVQCAIASLGMGELPTVKAATSFLVNLITQSRELASLSNVLNVYGEQLVAKVISCIAGEGLRSNIEPLADILLALNKKYCDNLSRWLKQAVNENTCRKATAQEREHFIKMVLRERANKRKLQDTVKDFSFMCRSIRTSEMQNTTHIF